MEILDFTEIKFKPFRFIALLRDRDTTWNEKYLRMIGGRAGTTLLPGTAFG